MSVFSPSTSPSDRVCHDLALRDAAPSPTFLPVISCFHAFAQAVPPPKYAIPFKVPFLLEAFSDLLHSQGVCLPHQAKNFLWAGLDQLDTAFPVKGPVPSFENELKTSPRFPNSYWPSRAQLLPLLGGPET